MLLVSPIIPSSEANTDTWSRICKELKRMAWHCWLIPVSIAKTENSKEMVILANKVLFCSFKNSISAMSSVIYLNYTMMSTLKNIIHHLLEKKKYLIIVMKKSVFLLVKVLFVISLCYTLNHYTVKNVESMNLSKDLLNNQHGPKWFDFLMILNLNLINYH